MTFQSVRVCAAGLAIAVSSFATPAQAQVVTFTDIRDAVPGKFFDPDAANTRTHPELGTPNTLDIAFENDEFRATTVTPIFPSGTTPSRSAMDTISFNVNAPPGYYVSSIAYHQTGTGSIIRVAGASGASSWVIDGQPADLGFFGVNPSLSQSKTVASGLSVVAVSITTGLFVFDPPGGSGGDATVELTSAKVEVTVAPISSDPKSTATIAVSGFIGTYDGAPHRATGTATGVNGEDLTHLLILGESVTDAPGGTANWTFLGDANYSEAAGTASITINPADATIAVSGYTGTYDGASHGATGTATGVDNENLTLLLNLGESFTDAPGGTANWTFLGDANYNAVTGTAEIIINPADATIAVSGYTGTYNGALHGATGTAAGVNSEDLTDRLNLGGSFTAAPGGTANWTFLGGANYNGAAGTAAITISKATPILTWPQPAAITAGTALTSTQLNATANVGGTFVYTPGLGTVLTATQPVSVAFTPADTVNHTGATATVTITVTPQHGNGKSKKG